MDYYTDGMRLYEVAARRTVQNYGLTRGAMRYVVLRDCISETTATLDDSDLLALTPVAPAKDVPLLQAV